MITKERVEAVLDRGRPFLRADGGDIEVVASQAPAHISDVPQMPPATTSIPLDDWLREMEASLIAWALKASHGNKSKAAELLHIKRSTLGDRIKRCGLGRVDHPVELVTAEGMS